MSNLGIYIHIPFCISKCSYCDFASVPLNDAIEKYVDSLIKEIDLNSPLLEEYMIDTIFIGGGTPSAIKPEYIGRVLASIRSKFSVAESAEITIEVNPGTVDNQKAALYRSYGINRISMGIQSFDDSLLRKLGRIHTGKDAKATVCVLREHGFTNINGDFIFGLPGQTLESFLSDLQEASELMLSHISIYGLIIEEGTPMKKWVEEGSVYLPDEDIERNMYHQGIELLSKAGYHQYEISNLSLEGKECKHNIGYWKLKPYLGLGLSAHSNIGPKRYWNTSSFEEYFNSIENGEVPIKGEENLDIETRASEFVILGLRMNEGVAYSEILEMFGVDLKERYGTVINNHKKSGLINDSKTHLQLTEKGMDLSNRVEIDFLPEDKKY